MAQWNKTTENDLASELQICKFIFRLFVFGVVVFAFHSIFFYVVKFRQNIIKR